jgi:hypothetical protein
MNQARLIRSGDLVVLRRQVLCSLLLALTAPCWSASTGSIAIDREIVLSPGHGGEPHVITKTMDHGFVIAGNMGTAWATRVSSTGAVVWEYWDRDEKGTTLSTRRGEFTGAVTMPDNSTLLCGAKVETTESGANQLGYLVRIDSTGKIVAQDSMYPNADRRYGISGFANCLAWGDGIVLVGSALSRAGRMGWIIKLDAQGTKKWERVEADIGGLDTFETQDRDLVMIRQAQDSLFQMTIVRIDSTGTLIARRVIQASEIGRVRSITPTDNVYIATHDETGTKLLTLDKHLRDVRPARTFEAIFFDHGCAYLYPDESLAVFGYSGNNGSPSAAIARVNAASKQSAIYPFKRSDESAWIGDAALISANEFVTVRQSVDADDKHRGVILDWVSIK